MAKKGLGRGFDSLIPTDVLDETFDPTAARDEKVSELRYIAIKDITPNPDQPRREFDRGATSLNISVYQIVAGERRWRAAGIAGIDKIPALVRTVSNQHKLEIALLENLQRQDLNPLETATAYLKLNTQFNLTHEEIAQRAGGKAVSTITNTIRLLRLPDNAKKALIEAKISEGHARQILALPDESKKNYLTSLSKRAGVCARQSSSSSVTKKVMLQKKSVVPSNIPSRRLTLHVILANVSI